ncbi:PLP-dependent aminotransferase family protein [Allorhizocola rhizosphaerae]|uniref:aminotransferase-like domain-containing protein n=1 Tax=Allorhizocola rhizosphaerae TaxID=1872709 RepID=UPI0013C2CE65|nr:PLP-dependent aminotransferase family protein [Allorhizocola rhizosphaerae]
MRYREVLTFPITLRRDATQPLHEQIADQIAAAIDSGAIRPGARIPSTRTLAELLGVSRGVASESFEDLFSRGYLESRPGSGTFVRRAGPNADPAAPAERPQPARLDLRPGLLCGEAFPIRAWRAAWRQASYHVPSGEAPPPRGLEPLRDAITEHLNRTRGISTAAHEVVVTTGTQIGLSLIIEALGARIAMERPISPALLRADACPIPVAVRELTPDVGAIVCCPDGNRPLGTAMSLLRRNQMYDWARSRGGVVVEVARDAVPRPRPVPLDPYTIIVGGFGELLTPTLKLGYALVPKGFAPCLAAGAAARGAQPPELTQLAVTHLLTTGVLARQTRRLGELYAGKLAIVRDVLGDLVIAAEPGAALLRTSAAGLPIRCRTLDEFGVADPTPVVGFGHLPDKALRAGLEHLLRSLP